MTRRRTAEELLRNMGMLDVAPPLPRAPGPTQLALLQERTQQAAAPGDGGDAAWAERLLKRVEELEHACPRACAPRQEGPGR